MVVVSDMLLLLFLLPLERTTRMVGGAAARGGGKGAAPWDTTAPTTDDPNLPFTWGWRTQLPLRHGEGAHRRRHAGVDRDVHERLAQLVRRHARVPRRPHVERQLLAAERGQDRQRDQ